MKFVIKDIKEVGNQIIVKVRIEEKSLNMSFSMSNSYLEDNKYIDYVTNKVKELESNEIENSSKGVEYDTSK